MDGYRGVQEFEKRRKIASIGAYGEAEFHDGRKVHEVVTSCFAYLRARVENDDSMAGSLLDLIQDHLLQGDPDLRYDSGQLHKHLDSILGIKNRRSDYQTSEVTQYAALDNYLAATGANGRARWCEMDLDLPNKLLTDGGDRTTMALSRECSLGHLNKGHTTARRFSLRLNLGVSIALEQYSLKLRRDDAVPKAAALTEFDGRFGISIRNGVMIYNGGGGTVVRFPVYGTCVASPLTKYLCVKDLVNYPLHSIANGSVSDFMAITKPSDIMTSRTKWNSICWMSQSGPLNPCLSIPATSISSKPSGNRFGELEDSS